MMGLGGGHFVLKCKCGNILAQCRCSSPLKKVNWVSTCEKCQADRCQFRHMMDARADAFCRCWLKAGHPGDCDIEFEGTHYAVSPNGYGAHPPRKI
jgi:hypothetical protein